MDKRVIDGRFELVERLGGGGMGLVWRAWDVALHREVALKEVRPPDPAIEEHDPTLARELRSRVLREARALARLNHPHVATIHHIVDPGEQGYPWIVMELVTGGSLQDHLQHGPLPVREAARLGREVLSGLRAAHAVGIQHRDVKPANVLLREDGRSVLTDFGIAAMRESTSLTATGSFIGSPEYMAPERINGVEGDPASDLWSLGMLLYVAVEGRHPLRRGTTLATLAAVLNQDVPPRGARRGAHARAERPARPRSVRPAGPRDPGPDVRGRRSRPHTPATRPVRRRPRDPPAHGPRLPARCWVRHRAARLPARWWADPAARARLSARRWADRPARVREGAAAAAVGPGAGSERGHREHAPQPSRCQGSGGGGGGVRGGDRGGGRAGVAVPPAGHPGRPATHRPEPRERSHRHHETGRRPGRRAHRGAHGGAHGEAHPE
ncbi:hypothetical protein GCM10020220_064650 [Nonomuraea rubra]|uniref:serine/threonine-protein kinase n=1 Tax=Nonomuraea rubra TaxID=46180 RepID=UPI0031E658D7